MREKKSLLEKFERVPFGRAVSLSWAVIELIYALLFMLLGIWDFAFLSGVLAIVFIITGVLSDKSLHFLLIGLAVVSVYASYMNLVLGSEYGFRLYFLTVIPTSFFLWYIYKANTVFTGLIITLGSVLYIGLEVLNQLEIVEKSERGSLPASILFSTFNGIFVIFSLISFFLIFFGKIRFKEHNFETQNERLTKLANVDPLTELLNRRSINQKLELAMQRKMNLDIDFTVAIGDIDDFKKLNDEYGHSCGDEFLKNLAESIRAAVRDTDYVCRWGGEEVLILFTGSGQEASGRVLERIMKSIEENTLEYEKNQLKVTMTFGVASSEKFSTVKDIILKADENLYQGKRSGKNCVVYS